MTKEEEKEIIRICGKDYDYRDIPAYIRKRDNKKFGITDEDREFAHNILEELKRNEK